MQMRRSRPTFERLLSLLLDRSRLETMFLRLGCVRSGAQRVYLESGQFEDHASARWPQLALSRPAERLLLAAESRRSAHNGRQIWPVNHIHLPDCSEPPGGELMCHWRAGNKLLDKAQQLAGRLSQVRPARLGSAGLFCGD